MKRTFSFAPVLLLLLGMVNAASAQFWWYAPPLYQPYLPAHVITHYPYHGYYFSPCPYPYYWYYDPLLYP